MGHILHKYKLELFSLLGLTLSLLAVFLYQNGNILKLQKEQRTQLPISLENTELTCFEYSDNKLVKTCDNPKVLIKLDNPQYIDNISFIYSTDKNYSWFINTLEADYYGQSKIKTKSGQQSKVINMFSENIANVVSEITLDIRTESNLFDISSIYIDNTPKYYPQYYIFATLTVLSIYLLIKFKKKIKHNPEYGFLIIAISFGISILLLTPNTTYVVWDDATHFIRSWEAIGGSSTYYTNSFYAEKDYTNFGSNRFNTQEEYEAFHNYLDNNNTTEVIFTPKTLSIKDIISYIPSSLTLHILNYAKAPFHWTYFFGRFTNLIAYVLVVFFAIRKTPKLKNTFTIIGLLPTTLFMATQYHYDPYVSGFILLSLAHLLNYLYTDKKRKLLDIILFIVFMLIGTNAKKMYIFYILLIFLIPSDKFKNKKQSYIIKVLCIIAMLVVCAMFINPSTIDIEQDSRIGSTSLVSDQIKAIFTQPISFLRVFYDSAVKTIIESFVGESALMCLSHLEIVIANNTHYLLLFLIIYNFFAEEYIILKTKDIILLTSLNILLWALVYGVMYISFTPVRNDVIWGVTYRYFLPLHLPVFLMLMPLKKFLKMDTNKSNLYFIYGVYFAVYIAIVLENLFPIL